MRARLLPLFWLLFLLVGCNRTALLGVSPSREATITIVADGESHTLATSAATVTEALEEAQIHLGSLDRVEPGEYLVVEDGMVVTIVRVLEQFQTLEVEIPFAQQIVRNEGLPEGERRLLQAGQPGLEEIVYRIEYHDGVEVERRMARRTILEAPADEIVMVGIKGTISPTPIQGTLAYISGGNGVVMRLNSGNRDAIVTSGDLDGRVFNLSPDGGELLYSRSLVPTSTVTGTQPAFNSLWMIGTTRRSGPLQPESLGVENVLWADWSPDGEQIAISTARPIPSPPGWEAHNDIWLGEWSLTGRFRMEQLLEPSSGGIYGWWGGEYAWSNNGRYLGFSQADQVGIIDVVTGRRDVLAEFSVYHTYADWVWVPIPTWSPDSRFLAAIVHGSPVGTEAAEDSQVFDLWAWDVDGWFSAPFATQTGMWGLPAWSPSSLVAEEEVSQIAFLQALSPLESANARYALWVMDRDGSNARAVFPPEGELGLRPQPVAWSPVGDQVALVHHGDLTLVNLVDASIRPLTSDSVNSNPVWAPWGQALAEFVPVPDVMDMPAE